MGTSRARCRDRGALQARGISRGGGRICNVRCRRLWSSGPVRPRGAHDFGSAKTWSEKCGPGCLWGHREKRCPGGRALMQRRRVELMLDALEMIKPLDRAVERRAFFLGEL